MLLTENDICKIVKDAVMHILQESILNEETIMRFPSGYVEKKGNEWKLNFLKNTAPQKFPDLEPSDFYFVGSELRHSGKKKKRNTLNPLSQKRYQSPME